MTTTRKLQIVEQLTELLSRYKYIVVTDYRGLSVDEISELRRQLRNIDTEYHVTKNTLAKLAAENAGKEKLIQLLTGPTALAFSNEEITQLAKTLVDYRRASKTTFSIKGGLLDDRVVEASAVNDIAVLPPVDIIRAKLLGLLQSPIANLQNVLNANLRGLTTVLNGRIQQLGGMTNGQ
ncbi:MAG: 50S ribosomal protein L10 [Chloroflexota bacterium]|nr:50S ribosomal protein L10 [Chloroflexota bacterium]